MKIPAKRLDTEIPLPETAHPWDAGVDLRARETVVLESGGRAMVPTGLAVAIPEGHVGLVAPRSGLAARHGLGVVNAPGVIDAGYRGEVMVILVNHGTDPVTLERGDRIAQLIVVPFVTPVFEDVDELPESVRGEEGFGSTGR